MMEMDKKRQTHLEAADDCGCGHVHAPHTPLRECVTEGALTRLLYWKTIREALGVSAS